MLCNPIGDDAIRAHRPLRRLAERLVTAGFAVLRFDYHGTGDSEGDERQPERVATWLEDVKFAVDELAERSGAESMALVGLRLGATLALAAAEASGVDRVVSWGGYARGRAFVTASSQFFRLHKKLEPRSFAGGPATREDGEEAFGFLLTHETLADLWELDVRTPWTAARDPLRRPGARLRSVLLVGDGTGRAEQAILEEHLRSLDVSTEVRIVPGCLQ
ncbi:MAG TPA: alpha/beta hydrolase, partial [Polyangiaceae bacterium]|nr:alpha/beta hydrolase [Polyangiaceae bacterium]